MTTTLPQTIHLHYEQPVAGFRTCALVKVSVFEELTGALQNCKMGEAGVTSEVTAKAPAGEITNMCMTA